jgi:hypothetical protein
MSKKNYKTPLPLVTLGVLAFFFLIFLSSGTGFALQGNFNLKDNRQIINKIQDGLDKLDLNITTTDLEEQGKEATSEGEKQDGSFLENRNFNNASSALDKLPSNNKPQTKNQAANSAKNNSLPFVKIISPLQNELLSKKVSFEVKSANASSVEFYLRQVNASTEVYLGAASKKQGEDIWKMEFDSRSFPNSKYFLLAKAKNQYGTQKAAVSVEIRNEVIKQTLTQKKAQQEILKTEKDLLAEQSKLKKQEAELKKALAELPQKTIEKAVNEAVKEETKQKVKETVKNLLSDTQKKTDDLIEITKKEAELKSKAELAKEIKEKLKEKIEATKEEVSQTVKAAAKVREKKVFEDILKDKQKKLKEHELEKEKREKELEKLQKELEETVKKKELLKKDIEDKIKEAVETVKKHITPEKKEIEKELERLPSQTQEKLKELNELLQRRKEIEKKQMKVETKDSDGDGIPDKEELRLGTNPFLADTDGDGVLDGIEIESGYDPKNPSPADKITYEEPKKSKAPITDKYKVEKIEVVKNQEGKKLLKIEGRGLPNSYVMIYIYSAQPLVLVTKTDEEGNFVYTLDKPLEEGFHQVYVAVVDNRGKIVERSEVFNFLKTPSAVAAILPPSFGGEVLSPAQSFQRIFTILVIVLVFVALVIALVVVGISLKKKKVAESEKE